MLVRIQSQSPNNRIMMSNDLSFLTLLVSSESIETKEAVKEHLETEWAINIANDIINHKDTDEVKIIKHLAGL